MRLFWTEYIALPCTDTQSAKRWWLKVFDCKEAVVPAEWDDTLPSDIALALPGDPQPVILLTHPPEVQPAVLMPPEHRILFTGNIKKANERLRDRGVAVGAIQVEGGTELFEIHDLEGNVIEICREP